MILPNSLLKTSDNSGALVVSCIKIKKQYGKVGKNRFFIGSINKKIKKK